MRWSVLAIWLLPAFCEDLTSAARSHANLTSSGENIITLAVWLCVVGLWMLAVRRFVNDERASVKASVLSNGMYVRLEGDEYLMVPADLKMQEEIRKENRRAKHVNKLMQTA